MPFNGSGLFTRLYSWQTDAANGVNISAPEVDAEDSGFATGLSQCLVRDGQAAMTGDLNMGTHNVVNAGTAAFTSLTVAGNSISISSKTVQTAVKTIATTRASNNTPTADPDLTLPVLSGKAYKARISGIMTGGAGGISFGLGCSAAMAANATYVLTAYRLGGTTSTGPFTGSIVSNGIALSNATLDGGFNFLLIEGNFVTTGAGNVFLNWAQFSSNAAGSNMLQGSSLELIQLN